MKKVLGSLVILAVLAFPVQAVIGGQAKAVLTELEKTRTALTSCNAMLGNAMAKIMAAMPRLSPAKQKQVTKRVGTLESEIRAIEEWVDNNITD